MHEEVKNIILFYDMGCAIPGRRREAGAQRSIVRVVQNDVLVLCGGKDRINALYSHILHAHCVTRSKRLNGALLKRCGSCMGEQE